MSSKLSEPSHHLAVSGGPTIRNGKRFPPWPQYDEAERTALSRVLESGKWGVAGAETEAFEKAFAQYQHCRHCVTMVNGSLTLRNALLAGNPETGSEVIVPPYTFLATATSVLEANCTPVFVDIDPDTYCLDPRQLEAAITPRTRAIIPVHLGGQPAAMDDIMRIARQHHLRVIEDCAHAHGAEYNGRRVGSLGDIGSFSFQSSKNLCCGEGGAVVTNDDELAEKCWSIHNCGRVRDGAWYQHENLGSNYRLSQFQAAILNEQLKKLDAKLEIRQRNAAYLNEKLAQIPGIRPLPRKRETTRHGYHFYVFRYDAKVFADVPRNHFLQALAAEGIPASAGYTTLIYKYPFMQKKQFWTFTGWRQARPDLDYARTACPVAETAAEVEACWLSQVVLLGAREDMDDIVNAVAKLYEHRHELHEFSLGAQG